MPENEASAMYSMYRYLKRAMEGEERDETRHDISIYKKCRELSAKHAIAYDGESFVPQTEELGDAVFRATADAIEKRVSGLIDHIPLLPRIHKYRGQPGIGTDLEQGIVVPRRAQCTTTPRLV